MKKVAGVVSTIFVYDALGQLVAEYSSEAAAANGTQYLTADHLGTPRVVTGADGVVKARHDYLPFGEEIGADVGGRTGKGYVADNVRQQFTGYERDHETGLDYAHARYYANTQGRFTSPDPLLSSSSIYDPQTWNRYSYTLNNPLKHTDPTGLYIWSATLGGGLTDEQLRTLANNENLGEDRQIYQRALDARAAFRNALAAAATARDALPAGAERDLVSASLSSYGAEGVANGVSVGRGRLADGVTAEARTRFETDQQAPFATRALVEVVLSDRGGGDLANDVAHEGRHVADAQAFATAFSSEVANGGTGENAVAGALNMTRYERETRGYTVSSLIAQGQGLNNYSVGRREIWNRGWAQADRATLRTAAIDNLLRESPTYRLTPRNPGGRFIPRP